MPYIKKSERLPYDELITRIFLRDGFNSSSADELINLFKPLDMMSIDGHFNYFLTKVFLITNGFHAVMNPAPLRQFILRVLIEIYPPKYFNYNRAIGMLTCVGLEYQRRHGSRASFLVKTFLDGVVKEFYLIVGKYEDTKIAENGDVI